MAKELSAKKYIETNARKLQIYKCYVNQGWKEMLIANVFVLRKHITGNFTAGYYLVDLACLGIKDTSFIFNQDEGYLMEKLHSPSSHFIEIDYNLAHNIIYAGYEYALDLELFPHSDFSTTKYILEEDNDNIPLIDVSVGGKDGQPHLILPPGQEAKYKHVYHKLIKNLGSDNFDYTVGYQKDTPTYNKSLNQSGASKNNENYEKRIDDFKLGTITRQDAKSIRTEDLANAEKVSGRLVNERVSLQIEYALRTLSLNREELFYSKEELKNKLELKLNHNLRRFPSWLTTEMLQEYIEVNQSTIRANELLRNEINLKIKTNKMKIIEDSESDESSESQFKYSRIENIRLLENVEKYQHNPLLINTLYQNFIVSGFSDPENIITPIIKKMADEYFLSKLLLGLCTYYLNESDSTIIDLIETTDFNTIAPNSNDLSQEEFNAFLMIRLLVNIRKGNIKEAIYYYDFMSDLNINSEILPALQTKFKELIFIPFIETYNDLAKEAGFEKLL